MKKVLLWETSSAVAGGQKMTLLVMDLLKENYEFHCLIPQEGPLTAELKKRNIPYTLMGDQSMPSGVKGKQVYFQYAWLSVKNILNSLRAICRFRPDLLYAPGPASLPWSAICGAVTGKPVVWHLHHLFQDGPTKKLLNFTCRWKSVRKIIAISKVVGDQIDHPVGTQKVECICNPVETERFTAGDPACLPENLKVWLSGKTGSLILLESGVLRSIKRQDLFACVVDALKKRQIPVAGILLGDAITEEDADFKKQLLCLIDEMGLQDDIYLAGHQKNVQDYLAAADFLFVPGIEGLSLAALEAMAARCDIVATQAGGVGELLQAADCGCLYPHEANPDQIADLIVEAYRMDRTQKLQNGIDFCADHTPSAYRKSMEQCFADCVKNSGR